MTLWGLLGAVRRVWFVTLAGLLGTAVAAAAVVSHDGVYWSQVDVVFLAPQSDRYPNNLTTTSGSLISTAGIVERLVNQGRTDPSTSSASATLVGEGVYDGYSVRLPDTGGQWAHNFDRQVLDVQVTGPSAEVVRERQARLLEEIDATLARLEQDAGVSPANAIVTETAALDPPIRFLPGERKRALVMTVLLGIGLTLAVTSEVDRRRRSGAGARPALADIGHRPARTAASSNSRGRGPRPK